MQPATQLFFNGAASGLRKGTLYSEVANAMKRPHTSHSPTDLHGAAIPLHRASHRASSLIDGLMRQMQKGMRDPSLLSSPEWEVMFGSKQSMVVNLLKLVQAMSALGEDNEKPRKKAAGKVVPSPATKPLSDGEMALLAAWLADTNGGGDSLEAG
jgi:hypothetical protein